MKRFQSCLVFLALILMGACEDSNVTVKPPFVKVDPPAAINIAPGGSAEAVVAITVAPDYYVQANPAAGEFLIPLTLELDGAGVLDVGKPVYPPPERQRLKWSEVELLTYSGRVSIPLPLHAARSAEPGLRSMSGSLRYQACSRHMCMSPKTIDFQLEIRIQS